MLQLTSIIMVLDWTTTSLSFSDFKDCQLSSATCIKSGRNRELSRLPSFKGIGQSSLSPHTSTQVKSSWNTGSSFRSNSEPIKEKNNVPVCYHCRKRSHLSFQCPQQPSNASKYVTKEQKAKEKDEPKSKESLNIEIKEEKLEHSNIIVTPKVKS